MNSALKSAAPFLTAFALALSPAVYGSFNSTSADLSSVSISPNFGLPTQAPTPPKTVAVVKPAPPLPRPNLSASKKFRGAKDIYSFEQTAWQNLPDLTVRVRKFDAKTHTRKLNTVKISSYIMAAARAEGVDPLIVQIIIEHESACNPNAVSCVGAAGLMQLMPETAREMGARDVKDPAQNIAAGTRYFARQYRRFANLHLALAAYNAGPGNVEKFGGVPPFGETMSYASSIARDYSHRRMLRRQCTAGVGHQFG